MLIQIEKGRALAVFGPREVPWGLMSGIIDPGPPKTYYLEHLVAFPWAPPHALTRILRAAIKEVAPHLGIEFVNLYIFNTHPMARGLRALAHRFKFKEYANDGEGAHFGRFVPDPPDVGAGSPGSPAPVP